MLTPAASAIIRTQVAWRLGCEPAALRGSRMLVMSHGLRLAGYHGIYAWLVDEATVISAPPEWVQIARAAIAGQTTEAPRDTNFWRTALGAHIERIVGPSYQGYVDTVAFRPAPSLPRTRSTPPACRIASTDLPALELLAAACRPQEWGG